jgi:hypothetical protein
MLGKSLLEILNLKDQESKERIKKREYFTYYIINKSLETYASDLKLLHTRPPLPLDTSFPPH